MRLLSNSQNLQKVEIDIVIFNGFVLMRVMRDIYDARRIPMEREWVALYLYVTCKYSNQLTLELTMDYLYYNTECIMSHLIMIMIAKRAYYDVFFFLPVIINSESSLVNRWIKNVAWIASSSRESFCKTEWSNKIILNVYVTLIKYVEVW